ncbi:MAG: biotin/lipoyl-containing protein, partial [Pseudomonadota bacterium]
AGAHVLGLKDMAGLLKPASARVLVKALKEEVGLPIHFHTHDTSGIAAASILAATEAGVDAVDAAMDAFSSGTSQPCLGSIVESLRGDERDTGLDGDAIRGISRYWEAVRPLYAAFESGTISGASEVYQHEMPGGQFTNLKAQARSLGLEERWGEIAQTYADVNQMFGDIPKVTPSSKVVGDMALAMVSAGQTRADVEGEAEVSFPDSVVDFFRGGLGQPPGGFPAALQAKVLKGEAPLSARPGESLPPLDLEAARAEASEAVGGLEVDDEDLCGYLMYPQVFTDYMTRHVDYGPVRVLPTLTYFYGMAPGDEVGIELEPGKTMVVRLQTVSDANDDGEVKVFFELNGQPRVIRVPDRSVAASASVHVKAEAGNPAHVAAPMPGVIATVNVAAGQTVEAGEVLMSIEAMKMETAIHAEVAGVVKRVVTPAGTQVDAKDLLVEFEG